jgi:hypothetical protein
VASLAVGILLTGLTGLSRWYLRRYACSFSGEVLEGGRVGDVFLLLDPGVEGFGGVVVEHGDGTLDENGAGVCACIDEVYGAAGDFDAVCEGLLPGGDTGEGGQEGGVDVKDAVGEGGEHGRFDDAHEAGQYDVIGLPIAQLGDVGLFRFAIETGLGVGNRYVQGRDTVALGAGQNTGGFHVGYDAGDACIELACGDGIDDRLAVGAATGTEHGNANFVGWGVSGVGWGRFHRFTTFV